MSAIDTIARQFLGLVPAADDNQRAGREGRASVISAPTIPIGGAIKAAPTRTLAVPKEQIARRDLIAALVAVKPVGDTGVANAVGAEVPAANPIPNVQTVAQPYIAPEQTVSPLVVPASAQIVQQIVSPSDTIQQQNRLISEALISRETQTDNRKKVITEKYSRTPSVSIDSQTLVSQQTETKGGVKTVRQIYSA